MRNSPSFKKALQAVSEHTSWTFEVEVTTGPFPHYERAAVKKILHCAIDETDKFTTVSVQ